jgi:hypothetical protein
MKIKKTETLVCECLEYRDKKFQILVSNDGCYGLPENGENYSLSVYLKTYKNEYNETPFLAKSIKGFSERKLKKQILKIIENEKNTPLGIIKRLYKKMDLEFYEDGSICLYNSEGIFLTSKNKRKKVNFRGRKHVIELEGISFWSLKKSEIEYLLSIYKF